MTARPRYMVLNAEAPYVLFLRCSILDLEVLKRLQSKAKELLQSSHPAQQAEIPAFLTKV